MIFQKRWLDKHCEFDPAMNLVKDLVKQTIYDKFSAHGENLEELSAEAQQKEQQQILS